MKQSDSSLTASEVYLRLLHYVKPYWKVFLLVVLCMGIFSATEVGMAALLKPLMDGSFVEKDPETIKWMPLAIIGLFFVRGTVNFLTIYGLGWISRNVIKNQRAEMFNQLLVLPTSFYDNTNSGQLMSKLLYDVEQVARAGSNAVLVIIRDSLTIIGLLIWLLYLSGTLALIILLTVPFIGLLIYKISFRFRKLSKNIQNSMGDVGHITKEIIDGHKEVKTFGAQAYETTRFEKINKHNHQQRMKHIATDATSQPIIIFIAALGFSGVIYLATLPDMLSQITVGTFVSFITAMLMILAPLKRLTKVNSTIQTGIAAAESVFNLLDELPEHDKGTKSLSNVKGHVAYNNVTFQYESSKKPALNQLSFDVQPGQTIAFVGHSGSGKTTLVNLLTRFYNVTSGAIEIDGENINEISLSSLRSQISLVNQNIVLFNDTIANNIAYGAEQALSEQDIIDAAKAAHAWHFIEKLPDGLQTEVGENGVLLSGGQRQRIAIARALLRDSPILILDEATASLDSEAERHIQSALDELMKQRTTFVIAHRLSTIENADQIIVMHDGSIIETGTHSELLAKGEHYAELHRLQFNEQ
jgi:subfamily B ATP-binding cassette protein MsbA